MKYIKTFNHRTRKQELNGYYLQPIYNIASNKSVVCSKCKKLVSVQFTTKKQPLILAPYTMVEGKPLCCKCLGD